MTMENMDNPTAAYKQLQRKLNQRDKELSVLRSTTTQLNKDMATLLSMVAATQPDWKPQFDEYMADRQSQSEFDSSSVQTMQTLTDLMDEHEVTWDDPRLESARSLLSAAQDSGDSSRYTEAARVAQAAIRGEVGNGGGVTRSEIEEIVRAALNPVQPGASGNIPSVDTGGSTARAGGQSRNSIQSGMEGKYSHNAMKELLDNTLSQMSGT